MRVLMLGAPGSGKGTQGKRIADRYHLSHVSTGDLLRQHVAEGTALGKQAKSYMDSGDLVPDDLILSMIMDRITGPNALRSYVLDGFPRTLPQAKSAYEIGSQTGQILDAVVCLDIPHDELIDRLQSRAQEESRADDTQDVIRHRIEVYEEKTLPLLDYYDSRGILHRIDAVGTIDEVSDRIFAELDEIQKGLESAATA